MNKRFWACVIAFVICFAGVYYWVVKYSPKVETEGERILKKIDSLTVKIDSIKRANDSIKLVIDTTEIQIKNVYNEYVEIRDHIIAQSPDSDCIFFSNYLSEDSRRYIDTINFEPIKAY